MLMSPLVNLISLIHVYLIYKCNYVAEIIMDAVALPRYWQMEYIACR